MQSAWLFAVVLGVSACGSSAPKVIDPAARPPLPPASGTPIGILLDDATRLHLRDDQLTALREIDSSLAARNDKLDSSLRPGDHPHDRTTTSNQPMGMGRGRVGHKPRAGRPQQPPPGAAPDQATQAHAQDERVANTRDALTRALALLDPAQRADATKLLEERGIDIESGTGSAAATATEPAGGEGGEGGAGGEGEP